MPEQEINMNIPEAKIKIGQRLIQEGHITQDQLETVLEIQKIENISAGGISFFTNLTKTVLWPGKRIEKILITLPDQSQLTCPILIKSIFQNNDPIFIGGKRYSYSCGAQFLEIDNNVRDNIIKYVLEKERNELKHLHREFE